MPVEDHPLSKKILDNTLLSTFSLYLHFFPLLFCHRTLAFSGDESKIAHNRRNQMYAQKSKL